MALRKREIPLKPLGDEDDIKVVVTIGNFDHRLHARALAMEKLMISLLRMSHIEGFRVYFVTPKSSRITTK